VYAKRAARQGKRVAASASKRERIQRERLFSCSSGAITEGEKVLFFPCHNLCHGDASSNCKLPCLSQSLSFVAHNHSGRKKKEAAEMRRALFLSLEDQAHVVTLADT